MALQRKLMQPKSNIAAPAAALVPKEHMLISINFPECVVGSGMRYAVATRARKYVHLFYIPTLTGFSVTPEAFAALRPRYADELKPSKMRRMLKAKRAAFDAMQIQYSSEAADRAKATLKALAT